MAQLIAEIEVYGVAKPGGSKKAFKHPKTGQIIVTDMSGAAGKTWRSDVQSAATPHFVDQETGEFLTETGPLEVEITFWRARPKSHYGTGKNRDLVKDTAPAYPTVKPDVDKLSRAVLDALTGIAWKDDAQVISKSVRKRYDHGDRTEIRIFRLASQYAADLPIEQRVRNLGEPFQQRLAA
jgi:Holliday junction resolvase RusA-like endonuclease